MSPRPIDRFVGAMHRQNGDELLLESGRPGRLRIGQQERVVLAQDVRTEQIELLLRDVLPEDCQRSFRYDGEIAFPYKAPSGPVLVRARRTGDRVSVSISQYGASASAPAAAPAAPVMALGGSARQRPPKPPIAVPLGPSIEPSSGPSYSGRGRSNGGQAHAIEIMPTSLSTIPSARTDPRPIPLSSPTDIPTGSRASGDTGPIELDMSSTGTVPMLGSMDLVRVKTGDIVGPAVVGTSITAPAVKQGTDIAGRAIPAAVVPAPAPAPAPVAATPKPPREAKPTKGAIDPLLRALVKAGGSDLHLTAGLAPRMRKDGDIGVVPGFEDVVDSDTIHAWLMEIAPEKSRVRFESTNDADYGYELSGLARLRCNAFRDRRGAGGVFRVIPATVLTADQLNLPQAVRDLTTLHKGLVVVTGPTGSGKSTTLAAMIDLANKTRSDHIITIEDPVEFVHQQHRCLINQREVHSDTESFSSGLRAALREDPDIILVGEMRDLETVSIAVETAETGHLVFGTLHTTTAVSTVDRIVDQFPADRQQQIRVMLSSALKGVVAQTLCKKIGGGRVAALEILLVAPAVSNLIREGKTFQIPSIMQTGKTLGMQLLNDALLALVQQKIVAADEALSKSVQRTELRALLERANLLPKT